MPINRDIDVNLKFNANAKEAQAQIQALQKSLTQLAKNVDLQYSFPNGNQMKDVSNAALELQQHLTKAFNVKTGNLDLSKLSASLSKSGTSLDYYRKTLAKIGPEGIKAFSQVTNAIAMAERPVITMNEKMGQFLTTLKNTAKWQISSSILHGFIGSLQKAYGYAQDLNESLNNIRIVTGKSTDEMADFAKQANEAAKALSTTTTQYTDAALIFYQQGLDGEAVTERADTVIKLANVTRQSAEDVSSYMTAVWNNFDDGSESLEHYADVITALGAATASSSAEIATGLEKFAAIASTVGLSYEYATTALATVVAQTRQSADIVGTAFKTLFARIQDLELGKTLDDGTDLGKYSQALDLIGVKIKDVNGQVRSMDDILDDMGKKWQTIDKATQIAVAQTVAGTRQYTQLVALMDNWDEFQKNLTVAQGSEGTLDRQAQIYAESWEAARKRVKASMESIYSDIINDNFFITMTNGITKLVDGIGSLVKGLGGVPGILSMIAGIFMQNFAYKIPEFISNLHQNWKVFTGQAKDDMLIMQQDAQKLLDETINSNKGSYNPLMAKEFNASVVNKAQMEINKNADKLTESERASYQVQIDYIKELGKEVELRAEALTLAKQEAEESKKELLNASVKAKTADEIKKERDTKKIDVDAHEQEYNALMSKATGQTTNQEVERLEILKKEREELDKLKQSYEDLKELRDYKGFTQKGLGSDADKQYYFRDFGYNKQIDLTDMKITTDMIDKMTQKSKDFDILSKSIGNSIIQFENSASSIDKDSQAYEKLTEDVQKYIDKLKVENNLSDKTIKNAERAGQNIQNNGGSTLEGLLAQLEVYKKETSEVSDIMNNKLIEIADKIRSTMPDIAKQIDDFVVKTGNAVNAEQEFRDAVDAAMVALKDQRQQMQATIAAKMADPYYKLGLAINAVSTATMLFTSTFRTVETLMDDSVSGIQKVITTLGALGMTMRAISSIYDLLNNKTLLASVIAKKYGASNIFLTQTEVGLQLSLLPIAGIIAGIVAAIAIATIAYKNHVKTIEKAAEAEKEKLQKDKEMRESLQEQKDNLDNLLESYDNLVKKQQDGEITASQLKDQAYQLCIQYGQEEIAVKSLSSSYTDLRNAILELQKANNEELNSSAERALNQSKLTAQADIKAGLKEIERDGNQVDFSGISAKSWNRLQEELGIYPDQWGHANLEAVANMALDAANREILNELAIEDEIFKRILDSSKDAFDEAQASRESYVESIVESTYTKYSFDKNDFEGFNQAVNQLTQKVIDNIYNGEITPEQEDNIRKQVLQSFSIMSDEYSKLSQKSSLIDLIININEEELKKDITNIAKEIDKLTEEELGALASNFDFFALILKQDKNNIKKAVDDFLDTFKSSIELQGKLKLRNVIDEILTSDKKASQSQINDLYKSNFNPSDLTKEEFTLLSVESQNLVLLRERVNEYEQIVKLQEQANEERAKAIDYELNEINIQKARLGSEFGATSAAESDDILERKSEEYDELVKKVAEYLGEDEEIAAEVIKQAYEERQAKLIQLFSGDTEVAQSHFEDVKKMINDFGFSEDQIKAVKEYNNEIKVSEKVLKEEAAALQEVDNAEQEYQKQKKELIENFDAFNKKIDEIQSAYKSLMTAAQEYQADGYLTADTYQALLNLSPQYLACLVNEEGQLEINKETIKEATRANYDNIASEKLRQIELDVTAVQLGNKQLIELANIYTLDLYSEAVEDNANLLIERIKALTATTDAEKQVQQGMINTVNAIMMANKAAKKGLDTDFDAAMGVSKRASQKDKKDLKKYDDEFDRYHDIKEVLEELADAISDVEKQQKHLYGKELARSLREENALLEQQEAAYRELGAQQKQEQAELVASLGAMGVAFDQTSGQITNYAQATAAALQALNDAITVYNASAQTEADKKLLEAAQKNYDEFKKKLERYDALIEEIRDTENKLDDLWYKKLENNLKAWEAEIKFTLDIREAEKTWKKFINEINENFKSVFKDVKNELAGLAEQASHLIQSGGSIETRMGAMSDIEAEIDKLMAGEESSMFASVSEAQEKLKEYMKDLQSDAEELYDLYRQAWDAYIDGIDQAIDKFNDLNNQYERLDDNLDHQAKMIELLYGEKAYNYLGQLYEAQSESLLGQMQSLNQQIEFYKSQYEDAASKWGADSEAAQKWKESWESAIDALHEKEEAYVEAIQKKAQNAINQIFDELDKKLTGGQGLELVQQHWQDALKAAEDYYDETERIYQIDRIENAYKDAIRDSSDLKTQQLLESIMADQVAALEGKTKLSKYDIELAEKRLAVAQAQAALEEAQNNKTSMKLSRGADGNWSYQYVADESDVADKTQAMLDKQNELYEFTKTHWQDLQTQIMDLTAEAFQRINDLEQEALTASPERLAQIQEELAYLQDYYWGDEGLITLKVAESASTQQDLNQATAELLWGLYDTDLENYTRMNEQEQALIDQLVSTGISSYADLYDTVMHSYEDIEALTEEVQETSIAGWTSAAAEMIRLWNSDDGDSIRYNIEEALSLCTQAIDQYIEDLHEGTEAAGEDFTAVGDQIAQVQEQVESLQGATDEMIAQTISELAEYEAYLRQCEEAWMQMKDSLISAMNQALEYLQKVGDGVRHQIENMRQLQQAAQAAFAAAQQAASASSGGGGGGGYTYTALGGGQHTLYQVYDTHGQVVEIGGSLSHLEEQYGDLTQHTFNNRSVSFDDDKKKKKFKTGGYTGTWHGDGMQDYEDGKLAILHQKELVLNESDTSNILKVVNIVRNLGQSLLDGISRKFSSNAIVSNNNNESNNNIFNITAEFPNATNVDDIREAILGLPNLVSQYVNVR